LVAEGSSTLLYVDSDNALGEVLGDIDDGFALSALLAYHRQQQELEHAHWRVAAVGSVFGNANSVAAQKNNRLMGRHLGFHGPYLKGADEPSQTGTETGQFLVSAPINRIAALGPLTNIADAIQLDPGLPQRIEECVVVGGYRKTRGMWPPYFPMEFNLTKDLRATQLVFASKMPLTVVPLDVARRLKASLADLAHLNGPAAMRIKMYGVPWQIRTLVVKRSKRFAVWDLVAAMYLINPHLFQIESVGMSLSNRGLLKPSRDQASSRPVKMVVDFDPAQVWGQYVALMQGC
jgi:inosine-uridine nucleoside N-ribohydrolase